MYFNVVGNILILISSELRVSYPCVNYKTSIVCTYRDMSDCSPSSSGQEVRFIMLWFVNFVKGNEDVSSTTNTHGS